MLTSASYPRPPILRSSWVQVAAGAGGPSQLSPQAPLRVRRGAGTEGLRHYPSRPEVPEGWRGGRDGFVVIIYIDN